MFGSHKNMVRVGTFNKLIRTSHWLMMSRDSFNKVYTLTCTVMSTLLMGSLLQLLCLWLPWFFIPTTYFIYMFEGTTPQGRDSELSRISLGSDSTLTNFCMASTVADAASSASREDDCLLSCDWPGRNLDCTCVWDSVVAERKEAGIVSSSWVPKGQCK